MSTSDSLTTEERRDYDIALKNGREGSCYEVPVGVVGGLLDTIDRLCAQIEELRGLVNRAHGIVDYGATPMIVVDKWVSDAAAALEKP